MLRGKFQIAGFMLLSLSVMSLILIHHQQVTTLSTAKDTGISTQGEPLRLWPFGKQQQRPGSALASEEIDPQTLSNGIHLVIKLRDRRVHVYDNRKLKVTYPIAVGKAGWETPIGNYKVMDMQPNPVWEEPWTGKIILEGPKNPLGARWIGFWTDGVNSIGFHGTYAENLMGQAVSHGCVRMRNRDVIALYDRVKIGTPITVKP
jgi:lipoprotein-anchoring transpeptidase ErfK/SrfK